MSVDIAAENAQPSTYNFIDMQPGGAGAGDISVGGFSRQVSVNVGETVHFCVDGGSTLIRIFRVGWYSDTKGFLEVAQIANTPRVQPELVQIPGSYGATTATAWTTTAQWTVPTDATSGMYMAMVRNAAGTNAFYISFVVRDDEAQADIIYKTSDATWGAAYNYYGTKASPYGKNVYGDGTGVGNIMQRCTASSYHRPVITRQGVSQTYWWACELPLIRFLERNGYKVKYVTSVDLDKQGRSLLQKGKIFLSSGHDEYWTQKMRDAVEDWRDLDAGKSIFMSGNEVFWRARYEHKANGESILWCFKDTMPGPSSVSRVAGQAFDPVTWTGTWKDTRWSGRQPEWFLTGTDFGMNGIYDYDVEIPMNPYGGHKVWGGTSLNDRPITITQVMGFEADHARPTQPSGSAVYLATYTRPAPGGISDVNGERYDLPGNIQWGIVSQRYVGGGLTVGFGTCQWSWSLDDTHDRGGANTANLDAQKFTINLLRDLGANPNTLMAGVTLQPINNLNVYGVIPSANTDPGTLPDPGGAEPSTPEPGGPSNSQYAIETAEGVRMGAYLFVDGQLVPVG